MDSRIRENASRALTQILDLRPGETFLAVTDEATLEVGEGFRAAAADLGADARIYLLPESARPMAEVPEALLRLIPDTDVAVTCFSGRPTETPFRIALIRELTRVVRRLGHAPGITTSMMVDGPMSVDYARMALSAHALMRRFDGAMKAHLTAPGGTDLWVDLANRPFATDAEILDGKWGNLPAGEIWCAPVEDTAQGVVVCDGSIGDLGAVPAPLKLVIEGGRIAKVCCADAAYAAAVEDALSVDPEARVIGELGIGLNPGARVTGNLLEDEKAGHTAHVAFGNNEDMGGGRNRSRTHRDFLLRNPTLEVTFDDDRVEKVLLDGEPTLEPVRLRWAGYRHVLVAVDLSDASTVALQVGDALARMSSATLTVCHVTHHPPRVVPLMPHQVAMPDPEMAHREEHLAVERIDSLVASVTGRGPDDYEAIVVEGQPAEEIVRMAKAREVDIVVIASTGYTRIGQFLLGNVAEEVGRNAHCQVLLAR